VQLPHGMMAVAISLAVLPTLSRLAAQDDQKGFRRTLGMGLRMVLVLIIPATVGLLVLAQPITALLFEHGKFTAYDTFWTAWALRFYLLGLVFAAIDWPLNYAFYARQNTLTPALVGILSVVVYLVVALALIRPLGFLGLVLADSAKHVCHALVMLYLTHRQIGRLADMRLAQTAGKALLAAGVMAGVAALLLRISSTFLDPASLVGQAMTVVVAAGLGVLVYLGLVTLLRVPEVLLIRDLLREQFPRTSRD
jgi:putative peptidoglycan lipid II flippase